MQFQPSQFSYQPYGAEDESWTDWARERTPQALFAYYTSDEEAAAVAEEEAEAAKKQQTMRPPPPVEVPPELPFYTKAWFWPALVIGAGGVAGGAYYWTQVRPRR